MAEHNTQRLEEALRAAATAGDTAAATQLAQEIRRRRAAGPTPTAQVPGAAPVAPGLEGAPSPQALPGQPPGAPPEQTPTMEADPFANIPTEIQGVALSDDIRQLMLEGQQLPPGPEKEKAKRFIAGRVAREAGMEGGTAIAIVNALSTGPFGIGQAVMAAGDVLASEEDLSFGDALELRAEFRRGFEETSPVATTITEIGLAVAGGAGVVKGLQKVAGPSIIAKFVDKLTRFKGGSFFGNVGRASFLGGTAGAVTEGITEGEPVRGGLLGAAAGPLGVGLVRAAAVGPALIRKFMQTPAAKGLQVLAKKMGVTADELGDRFLKFRAVTGKNPSIADISNPQAAAELNEMIAKTPSAVAIAREGAEAVTRARPGEVVEQVVGGRVVTTEAAEQVKRTAVAQRQFAEVAKENFKFTGKQVEDLLFDLDLRRTIGPALRRQLDEVLAKVPEGKSANLTGQVVNDIRVALRQTSQRAIGAEQRVLRTLADEIEGIGRTQSAKFGQAIDEFAQRSVRGEAITVGRQAVGGIKTSEFEEIIRQAADPDLAAGLRVGARSGLSDKAIEGVAQTTSMLRTIVGDTGMARRLQAALPEREFIKLREIAEVQLRSIENVGKISPAVRAEVNDAMINAVEAVIEGAVIASGKGGGGFIARVIEKTLGRLIPGISKRVVENIARDAFDPTKTKAVIAALHRAGLDDAQILNMYAVAATAAGSEAANIVGE